MPGKYVPKAVLLERKGWFRKEKRKRMRKKEEEAAKERGNERE